MQCTAQAQRCTSSHESPLIDDYAIASKLTRVSECDVEVERYCTYRLIVPLNFFHPRGQTDRYGLVHIQMFGSFCARI